MPTDPPKPAAAKPAAAKPAPAKPAAAKPAPAKAAPAKNPSAAKPAPAAKKPPAKKPPAKGASADSQFEKAGATAATFVVEVDGVEIGRFSEISGLQVDVQVEEYAEGGEQGFVHKLPGRLTWPNLVLKRGVTNDDNLFGWVQEAAGDGFVKAKGKTVRRTAGITLMGADGTRLRTWRVVDALPVRWSGPTLASASSELPEEELEIAHHGFRSAKP